MHVLYKMSLLQFTFDSNLIGSTIRVSCKSWSGSNVTVTPLGETQQVITMAGVGDDGEGAPTDSWAGAGNPAGYSGFTDFTSLTPDTYYTMTVEQDGTTYDGAFWTIMQRDFCVFAVACDQYQAETTSWTPNVRKGSRNGVFGYIEDYDKNGDLPVASINYIDDHGYTDTLHIDIDDTAGSGRYSLFNFDNVYNRILATFAYYGMLETDGQDIGYVDKFTNGDSRQYGRHKIRGRFINGDHDEAKNNPEEDPVGISAALKAITKTAWLATFGNNQSHINSANSLAFVNHEGPVEFIAWDRVTALPDDTQVFDEPNVKNNSAGPIVPWLGAQQISDIKGALDNTGTYKFKCLLASNGLYQTMAQADLEAARNGTDYTGLVWKLNSLGMQQPLDLYTRNLADTASEATELITDNVDGIAAQAASTNACMAMIHGDSHWANNKHFTKDADANNVALDMWSFSTGATGNNAQDLHPTIVPGYAYDGVKFDWIADYAIRDKNVGVSESTCLRIDVTWQGCLWKAIVNTIHIPDPINAPTVGVIIKSEELRKNTVSCC